MAAKKKAKHPKSAEDNLRALLGALAELHVKQGQPGSGELRWAAVNAADELAHALSESAQVPRLSEVDPDATDVIYRGGASTVFFLPDE